MKKLITAAAATLLTGSALAAPAIGEDAINVELEQVDHVRAFSRIRGWNALDRDSLLIWVSPQQPYLVELSRPSPGMRFANAIGVTEFAGRIHSRFDTVWVDGLPHRIAEIYRLSADDAKAVRSAAKR